MRAFREAAISSSSLLVSTSSSSSTCFCSALILVVHSASDASGLDGMLSVLRRAALEGRGISMVVGSSLRIGMSGVLVPATRVVQREVNRFVKYTSGHAARPNSRCVVALQIVHTKDGQECITIAG